MYKAHNINMTQRHVHATWIESHGLAHHENKLRTWNYSAFSQTHEQNLLYAAAGPLGFIYIISNYTIEVTTDAVLKLLSTNHYIMT